MSYICGFCNCEPCECSKHVPYAERMALVQQQNNEALNISLVQIERALELGALRLDKTANTHANLGKKPSIVLMEQLNHLIRSKL